MARASRLSVAAARTLILLDCDANLLADGFQISHGCHRLCYELVRRRSVSVDTRCAGIRTTGNTWHVLQLDRYRAVIADVVECLKHGVPVDLAQAGAPMNIRHAVIVGHMQMFDVLA